MDDATEKEKTKKEHPRRNKVLKFLFFLVAFLIILELILFALLYTSVGRYKNFWQTKAKEKGEITYLALGDSAAQGIGASSPMRGYVGLIAKSLEKKTGKKVRIVNVSVNGATVNDVTYRQIPLIKDLKPDLVTVEVGANDVKYKDLDEFKVSFKRLLPLLPDGTYVSNMPLFNSRPGSTQPAKEQSKVIEAMLRDESRLRFVDLEKQTSEHQSIFGFAPDFFHPNNLSYKNWYQAFWDQIEPNIKL